MTNFQIIQNNLISNWKIKKKILWIRCQLHIFKQKNKPLIKLCNNNKLIKKISKSLYNLMFNKIANKFWSSQKKKLIKSIIKCQNLYRIVKQVIFLFFSKKKIALCKIRY